MRLLSSVLGFVLRKAGLLALVMLSLFLGYLLVQAAVPALRDAVTDRDRLEQVARERAAIGEDLDRLRSAAAAERREAVATMQDTLSAEVEAGSRAVAEKQAEIEDLREQRAEVCGTWDKLAAWVLPGDACQAAEAAVEKADEALDTLEGNLARAKSDAAVLADPTLSPEEKLDRLGAGAEQSAVEREIDNKESELAQKIAEEKSLEESQASGAGWVVNRWAESWRWLAAIALLVLLLPPVLRVVSYFVLMPVVSRAHRRIHLAAGSETATADLRTTEAQRTLTVRLGDGEVLSARSEHVRPVQGPIRSHLLYDWAAPFVSFAAGLHGLSRITGDEDVTSAVLSTPDDPDSYLMRLDFTDHPGVVMHPKHVVGVIGAPELRTRWRWGIHSLATWQVRYIMFAGTGSLIVQGRGAVEATSPGGRSMRIEQHLVMGFDSRLVVGVNRTEVFWPYLLRRTPLVDDEFTGDHPLFWQKAPTDGTGNPLTRAFNAVFSALGKLLGF